LVSRAHERGVVEPERMADEDAGIKIRAVDAVIAQAPRKIGATWAAPATAAGREAGTNTGLRRRASRSSASKTIAIIRS